MGGPGGPVSFGRAPLRRSSRKYLPRIRRGVLRACRAPAAFLRLRRRTRNAYSRRTRSPSPVQARKGNRNRRVYQCRAPAVEALVGQAPPTRPRERPHASVRSGVAFVLASLFRSIGCTTHVLPSTKPPLRRDHPTH